MDLSDIERRNRFRSTRPVARLREGRTNWFNIRNIAPDEAEIVIFDEIGYWGTTASDFIDQLKAVTAPKITLRINSPGGEVFDGIAINSALRQHPAHINVYVDGIAASIASVIAMAGDTITMGPFSQMMIHDGLGICIGNAADMRETADLLDKCSDTIAQVYADRTGSLSQRNIEKWRKAMKAETWYSADEAVEAGLADTVDRERKTTSEATNTFDLSIFAYNGRDEAPDPISLDDENTDTETADDPTPAEETVDITPDLIAELRAAFGG